MKKLSNTSLESIRVAAMDMKQLHYSNALALLSHIEAIEMEVNNVNPGFVYVATNHHIGVGILSEEVGHVLKVRRFSKDQWIVASGKYQGDILHESNCNEIDVIGRIAEFTALKQENLQRLEEVKGLQGKVDSLMELSRRKSSHMRGLNENLSEVWAAHNAEREARIYFEATLEQAMLDHQPVVLPAEVKSELDYLLKGFTDMGVANLISNKKGNGLANHCTSWVYKDDSKTVERQSLFLKALVNGYSVEQKLTLPIAEQLADMIQEWTNEPTFDDEDAACLKLATAIAERTKEFYSKH